jgi:hypothetical protein
MAEHNTDIQEDLVKERIDQPKKDVGERTNQLLEVLIEKVEALPGKIAEELKFE